MIVTGHDRKEEATLERNADPNGNGHANGRLLTEGAEHRGGNGVAHEPAAGENGNGTAVVERARPGLVLLPPSGNGAAGRREEYPVLALFCYETPGSVVGRAAGKLAAALAKRPLAVHLFSRHDFGLDDNAVRAHVLGESSNDSLLDDVQEFTHRACNAFLQHFPDAGRDQITLLGHEWSTAPALSLLRSIKNLPTMLSLHSLERQRSDLTSELSKQIEEIELTGLRQAKTVLVHEQATAEVARYWVPECTDRLVNVRPRFPVERFSGNLDPGIVKARHQVGPVDPTVLFIGDFEESYGPDVLMKAMPTLLRNTKQVRAVFVGGGSLYWPLRVYARYLLLEHAVRMPGPLEGQALAELIQAADVVVVPSRSSTPWWPIQAAWAARRPVVATHEAAPALVEHQHDSVLFYPHESSCVWGIERVLFDPELGQTLADNGRAKLEERFGWNLVAEQVEELMATPVRS
jgi:glycosyltransferase involved in cell wall biosynthesis